MKILIIEDSKLVSLLIKEMLINEGYKIITAKTGLEGLERIKEDKPNLILLDKGLPDIDGLDICKEIYNKLDKYGNIPIIIISGMSGEEIEEESLMSGAIDFIEKPIDMKKLKLKIRNIKSLMINFKNKIKIENNFIEYYSLKINQSSREIYYENKNVNLERKEYELLVYLTKNRDKIKFREELMNEIWGSDYIKGTDRVIDTCICKLRNKIPILKNNLKTLRGVGYVLKSKN
ncbi:response regulator transcription factor [Haliovirga abyssi]|uniref:DNA-binding response regulator n=1 Tax=Haliovirga abyssi TaxID=2996794 RepID=A0AAU9E401_9FUSO|nr:response regulator transcription factor [Haliovirga abyssi]BDU51210.1 DNA-binding response regulator [Haliovirga abyssi]